MQKKGKDSVGTSLSGDNDEETVEESPPRRVSRSLQRAASVSVLGKDAANQQPKAAGATGGRTSKRSLSKESSSRRLGHSPTNKKRAPGRTYSGEGSLDRLVNLSEDEDDSSGASGMEDVVGEATIEQKRKHCGREQTNESGSSSGSSSSATTTHNRGVRRGSSSHNHSSPRRKPSLTLSSRHSTAHPRPTTTSLSAAASTKISSTGASSRSALRRWRTNWSRPGR